MAEKIEKVLLSRIEFDERFAFRSSYDDVDDLVDSFISTARAFWESGKDPESNGQQDPGRGYFDRRKNRWQLTEGFRRLHAMRSAYRRTHDSRFDFYLLIDDTGLSLEEMAIIALDKNHTGIRKDLTPLEEMRALKRFDFAKLGLNERYTRLLRLNLTEEQADTLQMMEKATGHAFRFEALEFLGSIRDEREMCMTAAVLAEHRQDRSRTKMEEAQRVFRGQALELPWFRRLFPQATDWTRSGDKKDELTNILPDLKRTRGRKGSTSKGRGGKTEGAGNGPPQTGGRRSEGTLLFDCPHCAGPQGLELGDVSFDGYMVSFLGKPSTPVEMDNKEGDMDFQCECCGEVYYYRVRRDENGEHCLAVAKTSEELSGAALRKTEPETMMWNDGEKCWSVIGEGGSVTRQIRALEPARKEGQTTKVMEWKSSSSG